MTAQITSAACSSASRAAADRSELRTSTFQTKRPPIRYPRRVTASGMPCSARRRPVSRGPSVAGLGSPASAQKIISMLSLHDRTRSAVGHDMFVPVTDVGAP